MVVTLQLAHGVLLLVAYGVRPVHGGLIMVHGVIGLPHGVLVAPI
ncbi:MAG: hypothetical protein QF535_10485 [Anaerolineales bacterium]|jgi:hypothetical protein|nr:hypothetical protein [Anaerolineales bacterium]